MTQTARPVIRSLSRFMGAEVIGVDVARPLSADARRELEHAFDAYKLLCFRDQLLTTDSLGAFARTWATPGGMAEVSIESNADANGHPNGKGLHPDDLAWHPTRSRRAGPVTATLLYGVEVPSRGGDTLFADAVTFATHPDRVYRHQWRRRDLLMWDDGRTMHSSTPFEATKELRTMFRTFVATHSGKTVVP